MSIFNTNKPTTKTVNLAGGQAYKESSKLELASLLLTSFLKDKSYESGNDQLDRIVKLVEEVDPKYAAKAAIYARKVVGMRSVSHVVAAEIGRLVKGQQWTKSFFEKVIARPDDITEIISYTKNKYKVIPNSMKKGLGKALCNFNDYELAKYRMEGKGLKLVDAVNLVHPKVTPSIDALVKGTLKNTETWESKLSEAGKDEEAKSEVWGELISTGKIGYMALVKNLRNIINQAPEHLDKALELLTTPEKVLNSKLLPFRYVTAIEQIQQMGSSIEVRKTVQALSKAVDIACSNVPKFEGKTLIVLDASGSMGYLNTTDSPWKIGALFASVLYKSNPNSEIMLFSDTKKMVAPNPDDSTLSIVNSLDSWRNNGGTNFSVIFEGNNNSYDRIIILSDMQGWIGYHTPHVPFQLYKARTGSNPQVFSFDLQGYGTLQFPENNIYCLAGWSEKVFDIIPMLEKSKTAFVDEIEKIEL